MPFTHRYTTGLMLILTYLAVLAHLNRHSQHASLYIIIFIIFIFRISQDIFWHLYDKGLIKKDTVDQLLCATCDKYDLVSAVLYYSIHCRYLADRFVEGICPFCAYPVCVNTLINNVHFIIGCSWRSV